MRDAVSARTAALTIAAHAASLLGRSAVLVPLALVLAGLAVRWRRSGAWAPIAAVAGAILLQYAVKAFVHRPRPPVHRLEGVTGTSFPSGHATEAAAFFLVLGVWATRSLRPPAAGRLAAAAAAAIIVAVAFSRVYLGVHYPTDVAAGILLGSGWAAAVLAAVPAEI